MKTEILALVKHHFKIVFGQILPCPRRRKNSLNVDSFQIRAQRTEIRSLAITGKLKPNTHLALALFGGAQIAVDMFALTFCR